MKLQENINRIKSMMIQEQDTQMDELFEQFINLTFPFMNELKLDKQKNDLWLEDEDGILMFTYFQSSRSVPGKILNLITIIEDTITRQFEMMFGNQYKKLLANWFLKKYNLKVDKVTTL
jgi:hypothetical protein